MGKEETAGRKELGMEVNVKLPAETNYIVPLDLRS